MWFYTHFGKKSKLFCSKISIVYSSVTSLPSFNLKIYLEGTLVYLILVSFFFLQHIRQYVNILQSLSNRPIFWLLTVSPIAAATYWVASGFSSQWYPHQHNICPFAYITLFKIIDRLTVKIGRNLYIISYCDRFVHATYNLFNFCIYQQNISHLPNLVYS